MNDKYDQQLTIDLLTNNKEMKIMNNSWLETLFILG